MYRCSEDPHLSPLPFFLYTFVDKNSVVNVVPSGDDGDEGDHSQLCPLRARIHNNVKTLFLSKVPFFSFAGQRPSTY